MLSFLWAMSATAMQGESQDDSLRDCCYQIFSKDSGVLSCLPPEKQERVLSQFTQDPLLPVEDHPGAERVELSPCEAPVGIERFVGHEQKSGGGPDRREQVKNLTAWPFRAIGLCVVHFQDDSGGQWRKSYGTGFLVGPRHVLTAAHNLRGTEGSLKQFTFQPGFSKDESLYESSSGIYFLLPGGYEIGRKNFDFALVILEKTLGKRTGWLGLLSLRGPGDPLLKTLHFQVAGYTSKNKEGAVGLAGRESPSDYALLQVSTADQESFNEKIAIDPEGFFRYTLQTTRAQSGGPILAAIEKQGIKQWFAVGLHIAGYPHEENARSPYYQHNIGLYFSPTRCRALVAWLQKYHLPGDLKHYPHLAVLRQKQHFEAEFQRLHQEAKSGEREAFKSYYFLALCYQHGQGTALDLGQAHLWHTKLIREYEGLRSSANSEDERREILAYYLLHLKEMIYLSSKNQDESLALHYAESFREKARKPFQDNAFVSLSPEMQERLRQSYAETHYLLARLYHATARRGSFEQAVTTAVPTTEAIACYEEAARYGHKRAKAILGSLLWQKGSFPEDKRRALQYYEEAARPEAQDSGDAEAQYFLARHYEHERSLTRDAAKVAELNRKIYEFYRWAASQGHAQATCNLGVFLYQQDSQKNQQVAQELLNQAVSLGSPRAQHNLDVIKNRSPSKGSCVLF